MVARMVDDIPKISDDFSIIFRNHHVCSNNDTSKKK